MRYDSEDYPCNGGKYCECGGKYCNELVEYVNALNRRVRCGEYELKREAEQMTLVMLIDNQTWIWKYPICDVDIAESLSLCMPPYYSDGCCGCVNMNNCSLKIYTKDELVFSFNKYGNHNPIEEHFRHGYVVSSNTHYNSYLKK
jgi:hypothetical protein